MHLPDGLPLSRLLPPPGGPLCDGWGLGGALRAGRAGAALQLKISVLRPQAAREAVRRSRQGRTDAVRCV